MLSVSPVPRYYHCPFNSSSLTNSHKTASRGPTQTSAMTEQAAGREEHPNDTSQSYSLPIRGRDSSSDLSTPPPPLQPYWYQAPQPPWMNPRVDYPWQQGNSGWYGYPYGYPVPPAQNYSQQAYGQVQQQVPQPESLRSLSCKQEQYGFLHTIHHHNDKKWRVNKTYRAEANKGQQAKSSTTSDTNKKKNKPRHKKDGEQKTKESNSKDPKIMRPAPEPTLDYIEEANEEPFVIDPPDRTLIILDLNGTLIYRPSRKKPTHMIARPFLKPFLRFLFENFAVMVWSSAKPENVGVLVENVLDKELRSKLVASWARDTFGLTPWEYNQNVQVYKDLTKVWADDNIQRKKPGYTFGKRFGQDCTILIDDSVLKAHAQPHNLLEIPEFKATAEQMNNDTVLREVAGYLQTARMQNNVSCFMREKPFKANGTWQYDWPDDLAEAGVIGEDVSLKKDG